MLLRRIGPRQGWWQQRQPSLSELANSDPVRLHVRQHSQAGGARLAQGGRRIIMESR
jgi:hypothetical protein